MTRPAALPVDDLGQAQWAVRNLLRELTEHVPELGARRRAQLLAIGFEWLELPELAPGDELVKVTEAARALGVRASRIYNWRSRKDVPVNAYPGGVLLSECRAFLAREASPSVPA